MTSKKREYLKDEFKLLSIEREKRKKKCKIK